MTEINSAMLKQFEREMRYNEIKQKVLDWLTRVDDPNLINFVLFSLHHVSSSALHNFRKILRSRDPYSLAITIPGVDALHRILKECFQLDDTQQELVVGSSPFLLVTSYRLRALEGIVSIASSEPCCHSFHIPAIGRTIRNPTVYLDTFHGGTARQIEALNIPGWRKDKIVTLKKNALHYHFADPAAVFREGDVMTEKGHQLCEILQWNVERTLMKMVLAATPASSSSSSSYTLTSGKDWDSFHKGMKTAITNLLAVWSSYALEYHEITVTVKPKDEVVVLPFVRYTVKDVVDVIHEDGIWALPCAHVKALALVSEASAVEKENELLEGDALFGLFD